MKSTRRNKKVLMAMSGGVDSSVSAAILKQKGYDVIGITMEIWPKQVDDFGGCCSASAVDDAKRVAAKIKIPHYVLNLREEFKKFVIDDFVQEYRNGRTPNPCIRCNKHIKFDLLLKKADELGADFVATGHYAVIVKGKKMYELRKASDKNKDQSYFLYDFPQEALKRVLFPLGKMTKAKTRQLAKKLGLSVADKKDSQEICFIENNNYGAFVSENSQEPIKPGPIYSADGTGLGMHKGIIYYTVGQRKGLGIPFGKPFYVTRIDPAHNAIIVGDESETYGKTLVAENVRWTSIAPPKEKFSAKAKIRYMNEETEAQITPLEDGLLSVSFKKPVKAITPGQSVVIYKNDTVLGGGIICRTN
ncbi:MAG: tRNA 2-thiouridine(34) synthase MnmA [Candidatus Margulisiibacteriota bacterium]